MNKGDSNKRNRPKSKKSTLENTKTTKKPSSKKTVDVKARRRNIKQEKNVLSTKIFAFLIFMLFIIYICGYFFVMINRDYVKTATILSGIGDAPLEANGVITRDETAYKTDKAGELKFLAGNLDKVKKGDIIAVIENKETADIIKKDLINIENEILNIQEFRDDFSVVQSDAKRINDQIQGIVDSEIFYFSNDNLEKTYAFREEINKKIELRNKLLIKDKNTSTSNLIEDRNITLKELYKNEHELLANDGGIVSYFIDGGEDIYKLSEIENLDKNIINKKVPKAEYLSNRVVESEEPVFKIITSNTWYVSAFMNSVMIEGWEEGEAHSLYIYLNSEYKEVDAIVEKIIPDKKESYVIFKLTKSLLDYVDVRHINFKITDKDFSGYKIPISSIAEKTVISIPDKYVIDTDGNYSVKRKNGESVEDITLTNIDWSNEEASYYFTLGENSLTIGDVLANPENLEETFNLENVSNIFGVYIVNSGMAKFTRIYLDEILDAVGTYVLLDPEKNTNVNINDEIVLDGTSIKEDDRIYKKE